MLKIGCIVIIYFWTPAIISHTRYKQAHRLISRQWSGRLNGSLVATSDCWRRVGGGLGVSKVGTSRRLVLRLGASVGLDDRIMDVVTVGQGSKRCAA
ncbi:hypothetical protein KCU93_g84, partial [Aureobasidium melanogenum]